MSGHSKWANIKHKKARVDAQKGKIFTKLGREIIVAARLGGADPNANFRLKIAVQKAKSANMPTENIQRAIQRGAVGLDGSNYEEILYEGYGPGGVAVMMEIMTDNRNRTAGEIRHVFSKNGGNLGETGCVSWMFKRQGQLIINREETEEQDEDEVMLLALDAGAEDVRSDDETFQILTDPDNFELVKNNLEQTGFKFDEAGITMIPQTTVAVADQEQAIKLLRLIDLLDDHDDVQEVYANFDIDDSILENL